MGKKGLQERFHQRTRQTNKTKNTKWSEKWGFKACRLIFEKNFISILSTEGHLLKNTHGEATGLHDKANYGNSIGSNTITLYSNDNDN